MIDLNVTEKKKYTTNRTSNINFRLFRRGMQVAYSLIFELLHFFYDIRVPDLLLYSVHRNYEQCLESNR